MSENAFPHSRFDGLEPYKPSSQEAWRLPLEAEPLKLDWNESPLQAAPSVLRAVREFLERPNALNWYPDAESVELRKAISEHWKVDPGNVQTFCGSDSALQAAARVFTRAGETVLMISPTYDNFRIYALEAECKVVLDGPSDIYTLKAGDVDSLLARCQPRLVYLANPNNPTGWLLGARDVQAVAAAHPDTLFLLDEAYGEYSGETTIRLAVSQPNVVVARTFSKAYGLAGMRIGYLIATPGNVAWLNLIRNGKNVSMLGQVAAIAALHDQEYLQAALAQLRQGLAVLVEGLGRLGIQHQDTPANFVLIKVDDPQRVQRELARQHIYIRSMSHLKGMTGYLRITLGNAAQMRRLVGALEQILNGASC